MQYRRYTCFIFVFKPFLDHNFHVVCGVFCE